MVQHRSRLDGNRSRLNDHRSPMPGKSRQMQGKSRQIAVKSRPMEAESCQTVVKARQTAGKSGLAWAGLRLMSSEGQPSPSKPRHPSHFVRAGSPAARAQKPD